MALGAARGLTLEQFFERAAARGERITARVRLFLAAAMLAELAVENHRELLAGETKYVVRTVDYAAAFAFSIYTLWRLRRPSPPKALLYVSVAVDPLVAGATLLPWIFWPGDPFVGYLETFATAGLVVSTFAAGTRIDVRVTSFGVAVNTLVFIALLVTERLIAPEALSYGAGRTAVSLVIFGSAALLAVSSARRGRSMVLEARDATVTAERAHAGLASYVSAEVADEALVRAVTPGVQRRTLAILFADLRGFTGYAEKVEAGTLVGEMNAYFEEMIAAIQENGGTVDKFAGDAIMAVFGASTSPEDDAAHALRAAHAMQRRLTRHNHARASRNLSPLLQGIGVHFGQAVVGNIGTIKKLQHTVMGDVVNVASRLESATKAHRTSVFLSEDAVRAAESSQSASDLPQMTPFGEVSLAGREKPIRVYTLNDSVSDDLLPAADAAIEA